MKKTVIHFVYSDKFSGLERMASLIIKNLPEDWQGYYVAPDGEGIRTVESMGIKCIPCNTHSISEIKRIVKEYSPTVIHAHDPHISMNVSFAGVPYIAHLHNNCPWMKTVNKNSLGLVIGLKSAKHIFCVSPNVENEYIFGKFFDKKTEVLYNIVDFDDVQNKAQAQSVPEYDICFVGRFTEQKQPLKFLELVNLLKDSKPDVKAVMVGEGELFEETLNCRNRLGLKDNVDFTGFVQNPYVYMNTSKICVLTSHYEGFGLVAVEAMVLGRPVVCFPSGGIADIVNDQNGKLCSDVGDMSHEILKLLFDKELYNIKSQYAKESSRRFTDIETYIRKITRIYDEKVIL